MLHAGGVGELLDPGEIGPAHRRGDADGDPGRCRGGHAAGLAAGQPRDHRARLALKVVDLDELGEDLGDRLHRLRDHRGRAERGHRAGNVDDRAQTELLADVGAGRGHEVFRLLGRRREDSTSSTHLSSVMAGLGPAIHV